MGRLVPIAIPVACHIISLVLVCMVLFGGFNGGLRQVHWLKTTIGDFEAPAVLSGSEYMSALSNVTGVDYVGSSATAASLGLPQWTSTHMLTECATYADGTVDCDRPSYGFRGSPARGLRLEATSAAAAVSEDLASALRHYARASPWISAAFTAAAVSSLLCPAEAFFLPPLLASFTAGLTALLLLAATITATVVSRRLVGAFNARMPALGMTAAFGASPVAFGFAAAFLTSVATAVYAAAHWREQRGDGRRAFDRKVGTGGGGPVEHKYVQIEETGLMARRRGSPDGLRPGRLDVDWGAPDEYAGAGVAGRTSAGPAASVPLMPLAGNQQKRDLNTAYEPYTELR